METSRREKGTEGLNCLLQSLSLWISSFFSQHLWAAYSCLSAENKTFFSLLLPSFLPSSLPSGESEELWFQMASYASVCGRWPTFFLSSNSDIPCTMSKTHVTYSLSTRSLPCSALRMTYCDIHEGVVHNFPSLSPTGGPQGFTTFPQASTHLEEQNRKLSHPTRPSLLRGSILQYVIQRPMYQKGDYLRGSPDLFIPQIRYAISLPHLHMLVHRTRVTV